MLFSSAWIAALTLTTAATRVVVPGLEAQSVDEDLAASLTGVVLTHLEQVPELDVLGQSDVQRLLQQEQYRQLVGCGPKVECFSNVVGLLDAAQLVTGSVGRVGDRYLVSLSLLRTDDGSVLRRVIRQARSEEHLIEAAREATAALFTDAAAPIERCVDCDERGAPPSAQLAAKLGNDFNTFFRDGLDVSLFGPSFDLDFAYRAWPRLALTFSAGLSFGRGERADTDDDVRFQVVPLGLGARYYFEDLGRSLGAYTGLSLGVGLVRTALSGDASIASAFAAEAELGALYALSPRWSLLAEITYGITTKTPAAVRSAPLNAAAVNLGVALGL